MTPHWRHRQLSTATLGGSNGSGSTSPAPVSDDRRTARGGSHVTWFGGRRWRRSISVVGRAPKQRPGVGLVRRSGGIRGGSAVRQRRRWRDHKARESHCQAEELRWRCRRRHVPAWANGTQERPELLRLAKGRTGVARRSRRGGSHHVGRSVGGSERRVEIGSRW